MIDRFFLYYILFGSLVLVLAACDSQSNEPEPEQDIYVIQVVDESFRVKINDEDVAAAADSLLSTGAEMNIIGPLRPGDGGFNAPYSWHLDPDSISFVDLTIEVCDGKPSFVEEDLDYWMNTVETYCPWGINIIGRE